MTLSLAPFTLLRGPDGMSTLPPPPERVRRVLVASGRAAYADELAGQFRNEGYEVDVLDEPAGVVGVVQRRSVDLVLLDADAEGVPAMELCADLRMLDETKSVAVVFVTDRIPEELEVASALLIGADDYLGTTARLLELSARVRVQMRHKRERELLDWTRRRGATLRREAFCDPLTGVVNRRGADRCIDDALASGEPLVVLLCDVDHFKRVNDEYGHQVGDRVLVRVAQSLNSQARKHDVVARWGGEEFIVVARGARAEFAASIGERYRRAVSDAQTPEGQPRVTISVGVAWAEGAAARATRTGLVEAADNALYRAKRAGRDRVELAVEAAGDPPRSEP